MPNTTLGLGAILFRPNISNVMQVISYSSRIETTQEQKLSTYDRIEKFVQKFLLSHNMIFSSLALKFQSLFSKITILFSSLPAKKI